MDMITADQSHSLSPLPPVLRRGLPAVAAFGILSFVASTTLFLLLAYRLLFKRRRKVHGVRLQFVVLIFNLLLADIQQSLAFMLNAEWLVRDEIAVGTSTCWTQGWFVSTGDLSSGVWTIAIGFHTFASVAYGYRLSAKKFYSVVALLWIFVYAAAILGVVLHPADIYVRAGAWCWINARYTGLRLWAHYFWIFLAEFGTLLIYASLFLILRLRIRTQYFGSATTAAQAQRAAKLLVVYPLIYVVCTLPLASARMASITGGQPGPIHMCVAGAMITCNGWLDVLVYVLTRRVLVFGDYAPEGSSTDDGKDVAEEVIDTFYLPFWNDPARWGTTTVIESSRKVITRTERRSLSRQSSTERLFGAAIGRGLAVKTETTVEIRNEPVELADISRMAPPCMRTRADKDRESFDTKDSGQS